MNTVLTCPNRRSNREQDISRHKAYRDAESVGLAYHQSSNFVVTEFVMDLPETWMQRVCLALCRRHGLLAWRDHGKRRHKILVAAPASFMADVFQPGLDRALNRLTTEIYAMTLHYIETHIDEPEPAEKPTDEPEMPVETYEVEEWG